MSGENPTSTYGSLVTQSTTHVDRTRHTISPYDFTLENNTGTIISNPLLTRHNYNKWCGSIEVALHARKKYGFADGSIKEPEENSEDFEDLHANNALVVSWIKLNIDLDLASSISHHDNVHSLWTHINTRFAMKNGRRV